MKKHIKLLSFLLSIFVLCTSCNGQEKTDKEQSKTDTSKDTTKFETKEAIFSTPPKSITRNIIQDRKGNIWMAAFDGIFRYDGKSFFNMISGVSSARFFSLLEDRNGNFWFGSIGSGIYYYDGYNFRNFTTKDGLLNNEVTSIYEDKNGNIWFGVSGGASRYDGKSFQNYIINGESMKEDRTGKTFSDRQPYEVNSIIEDKTGNFWFATRGNTFVYDGKTFTVFTHEGKPFKNVRTLTEDKRGNIWLGGNDGLWRHDGTTSTMITQNFVGYIHEDKRGNVWTSSQTAQGWVLSRYDEMPLSNSQAIKLTATEIKSGHENIKKMIFGILEANDGVIWFGALGGVYRYDGKIITDFEGKEVKE